MKKIMIMLMAVCTMFLCGMTVNASEITTSDTQAPAVVQTKDSIGVPENVIDMVDNQECSCGDNCKSEDGSKYDGKWDKCPKDYNSGDCSACGGKSVSKCNCCDKCKCGCKEGKPCTCSPCKCGEKCKCCPDKCTCGDCPACGGKCSCKCKKDCDCCKDGCTCGDCPKCTPKCDCCKDGCTCGDCQKCGADKCSCGCDKAKCKCKSKKCKKGCKVK